MSMAKGLKLKVRKFWRLFSMFVEVTGEKLVEGDSSWIRLRSIFSNTSSSNSSGAEIDSINSCLKNLLVLAFFSDVNVKVTFLHCPFKLDTLFNSHNSSQLKNKISNAMAYFYRISVGMAYSSSCINNFIQIMVQEKIYQPFLNFKVCGFSISATIDIQKLTRWNLFWPRKVLHHHA